MQIILTENALMF